MAHSIFAKLFRTFGRPPSGAELQSKADEKRRSILNGLPIDDEAYCDKPIKRGDKVAIVGGGFAGLTAAYYLTRFGAKVVLFEAGKFFGGRVRTKVHFAKHRLIEEGAELIGLNHAMWLHFAKEFGLGLSVVTPESHFTAAGYKTPILLGGTAALSGASPAMLEQVYHEANSILSRLNTPASKINPNRPWAYRRSSFLDSVSVDRWLTNLQTKKLKGFLPETWQLLRVDLENDQAVKPSDQSFLGLLSAVSAGATSKSLAKKKEPSEYWTETEVFRCSDGNISLARALFRRSRHSTKGSFSALRNTSVPRITVKTDSDDNDYVNIETDRSSTPQTFRRVVIATPPSSYGALKIPYQQRWPKDFLVQAGKASKYLAQVDTRFWISQGMAPSGSDDYLGSFWEGTDNQAATKNAPFDLSLFSGSDAVSRVTGLVDRAELKTR
jgi:monoamine oxidase